MRRRLNITGSCNPQKHYMVRLDNRLKKIKEDYVDEGSYFVINKGRQYGKTTTLQALEGYLSNDYVVFSLDFQKIASKKFMDETAFSKAFAEKLLMTLRNTEADNEQKIKDLLSDFVNNNANAGMDELFICFSNMCEISSRPVVLMIDEVDSAGSHQVFLDFLSQLRGYYLEREKAPVFHSVILVGVYDIKNLKLKLRPEAGHQYNSPWNIAAKFKIDMSFSADQIAGMLEEYEADHHTGMDLQAVAGEIYEYTSGYPVLVSSICKYIDEDLPEENEFAVSGKVWSKEGITEAVKRIPFSPDEKAVSIGCMFGFLTERDGCVAISNRIFEMYLLNLFMTEEAIRSDTFSKGESDRILFIKNNRLDMVLILKKFVEHFTEIYGENNDSFIEAYGRKLFLLYLKPIINGTGNYYIEAQTRDARRTDVIVDYLGEQFIIELKIWHGSEYNERGERQLIDYLEYYHKDMGYMISFNFNKKKEIGVKEIKIGNKTIIEAVL